MNNMKKCEGCGVYLQDHNILEHGYITDMMNNVCQRCFRLKNYGEYQVVTKSHEEYLDILRSVGETKDLVIYLVDILNIERDLTYIREYIPSNKMILVLNKRDVLPKSINDEKLEEYMKNMDIIVEDIVTISTVKNYNIDLLLKKIKLHQTSKHVYVVGHTNAGKSTLINKLIKNYSDNTQELTISPLPATTLNTVHIFINDHLVLIDTPGLVDNGSIVNTLTDKAYKKISPRKEIKPKTYQIKKNQSILIEDLVRIDYIEGEKNSFTIYASNELKIKRLLNARNNDQLKELAKVTLDVKYNEDLVINGLGFIKIVDKCTIDVYIDKHVDIFVRKKLI